MNQETIPVLPWYSDEHLAQRVACGVADDASIRDAAREYARMMGVNATPEPGCELGRYALGPLDALVEYEYEAGEPERWNAMAGVGNPAIGPSVSVLGVLLNGRWVELGDIRAFLDTIEDAIIERAQE